MRRNSPSHCSPRLPSRPDGRPVPPMAQECPRGPQSRSRNPASDEGNLEGETKIQQYGGAHTGAQPAAGARVMVLGSPRSGRRLPPYCAAETRSHGAFIPRPLFRLEPRLAPWRSRPRAPRHERTFVRRPDKEAPAHAPWGESANHSADRPHRDAGRRSLSGIRHVSRNSRLCAAGSHRQSRCAIPLPKPWPPRLSHLGMESAILTGRCGGASRRLVHLSGCRWGQSQARIFKENGSSGPAPGREADADDRTRTANPGGIRFARRRRRGGLLPRSAGGLRNRRIRPVVGEPAGALSSRQSGMLAVNCPAPGSEHGRRGRRLASSLSGGGRPVGDRTIGGLRWGAIRARANDPTQVVGLALGLYSTR